MKPARMLALAALLALSATPASPCSVCFGDPASPLTQGAKAGVIFLGLTIYALIMMMGGVGMMWYFRARRLCQAAEAKAAMPPAAAVSADPPGPEPAPSESPRHDREAA